jgi:hypothetical protein
MTGVTPPPTSPWIWEAGDNFGRVVRITLPFDATGALAPATVYRDAGCQWGHIYIGVGADGSPNSTPRAFTVPDGSSTVTANQLRQRGLNVIDDVVALQITAGP